MRRILILAVCTVGAALAAFVMSTNNAWAPQFWRLPSTSSGAGPGETRNPKVVGPKVVGPKVPKAREKHIGGH
jgi:hypothetical protein